MTFPAESVPDGALFAPHHAIYAWWAALLVLAILWDDLRHAEPVVVAVLVLVAMFGWYHVWTFYPVAGASMVLGGTLGALAWLVLAHTVVPDAWTVWDEYPLVYGVVVLLLLLVALDDAVSHALGWPTPLDEIWKRWLYHLMA